MKFRICMLLFLAGQLCFAQEPVSFTYQGQFNTHINDSLYTVCMETDSLLSSVYLIELSLLGSSGNDTIRELSFYPGNIHLCPSGTSFSKDGYSYIFNLGVYPSSILQAGFELLFKDDQLELLQRETGLLIQSPTP